MLGYLNHLSSARQIVQCEISQVRPIEVGEPEKGMSFEVSQGMSRVFEVQGYFKAKGY